MPSRAARRLSSVDAGAMRSRARGIARRAARRVGPIDRLLQRVATQSEEIDDLRRRLDERNRLLDDQRRRSGEPDRARLDADFFAMLSLDGDVARAAVTLTRRLITRPGGISEARTIGQVLGRYDGLRPIADICLALCAFVEPMPEPAWALFGRNDVGLVVTWAAEEYFRLGFSREPAVAAASLERVLSGEVPLEADPHVWLEIARAAFVAGRSDLADRALDRADGAIAGVTEPDRVPRLRGRVRTLREWLSRAADAHVDAPRGEIPFALVGYGHPDRAAMAVGLDDFTETLVVLGHLARRDDVRLAGDADLLAVAEQVRLDAGSTDASPGDATTVRLYQVDRDASRWSAVPDGTWTIVSDWFARPAADDHVDLPMPPSLRPVFVSFHITPVELGAPGVVDYLREHGPVGCRDWDTVFLLHAAGVPAFFSGALAMTADVALPAVGRDTHGERVFVGVRREGPGRVRDLVLPGARDRSLGVNLATARNELRRYRDAGWQVVTTDVRLHLAARALGCRSELRLAAPEDYRALDYVDLDDERFAQFQTGIRDKLDAALGAIVGGGTDAEVRAAWRAACEADVAAATAELARYPEQPAPSFDIAEACGAIRAATLTTERTQPGPAGSEINVEFSVDENYKHQFEVVLDSVVLRAGRPVRAFVLSRGWGADDFVRMARLFPTVSFVWMQTDRVDYGNVRGMFDWVTTVTMDRTLLPELLDDVDRIVHFDLDALCLDDLAGLFDTDLEGSWIAAVDEPQPAFGRGFVSLRDSARLLRAQGRADLAREYLIRTHSRLAFDFEIFNAGIMVLDLAAMRAGDFCAGYVGYAARFGINDQRLLNVSVGRDRKKVDRSWNRLLRLEVVDSARVAHWAGPFKPWSGHQYVPGRELWEEQERSFAERVAAQRPQGRG